MNRSTSVSSKNFNATISSDAKSVDAVSTRGTVTGEARSETWRRRQSSITFSRLASSLNADVFDPRLGRVSPIKPSVSTFDVIGDGASRSSQAGSVGADNTFDSYGSEIDRTGLQKWLRVPNFFDGVNERIWWKLVFHNEELECQYQSSQEASAKTLFRMACAYLALACLTHALFLGISSHDISTIAGPLCYAVLVLLFMAVSYTSRFQGTFEKYLCRVLAMSLTLAALLTLVYPDDVFSDVARFSIGTIVLTVLYLFLPLDLHVAASLGAVFSLVFEIIQEYFIDDHVSSKILFMKLILHLCLHCMLASINLMSEVFRRNTFWRIGRSLLYQDQLDLELALKEKMIHSVMPEIIASELLEIDDNAYQNIFKHDSSRFRPLMLHRMDNVTILFADIVGFTKMSSSKSASALVTLLNNLFHRFDKLAEQHGCEKISTLGDCYYCVAGCPIPCLDHADRCVQMGLSMCRAIVQFCRDTGEDVNMRVGIHTGTVLCGIVGVHRFKFDVFSNDVQLANQMESGGVPGMVHISQSTLDALVDPAAYHIQPGDGAARNEQLSEITTHLVTYPEKPDLPKRCISEPALEGSPTGTRKKPSRVPTSFRHQPPQLKVNTEKSRRWIESPATLSPSRGEAARTVNSRSLLRVPSIDGVDEPATVVLDSEEEALGIGGMLKERDAHEAPRVKVRLSELAVSDLLRITVAPLSTEKSRQEEARKARLEEEQMVIKVLNNTWDRLIELKNISGKDLSMMSLVFIDQDLEALHRLQFNTPSGVTSHTTFDSPIFSYFLQVVLTFVMFVLLSIIFFTKFMSTLSTTWIVTFGCFLVFHIVIVVSVGSVCYVRHPRLAHVLRPVMCNWWIVHGIVLLLLFIPMVLVAINWPCTVTSFNSQDGVHFNIFVLQVSLTMCLLFTQLHRIIKLLVGTCVCALLVSLVRVPCSSWHCGDPLVMLDRANATELCASVITNNIHNEAFLIFSVYLVLIVVLNRQYEAASRLNFKSQLLAQVSFEEIQQLKEQADSLLNNLLPDHVCQHLKVSSTYSENHEMVGVIFATIVNFSDFYSENFEGGIGCIRVLNELISDFDDLLCKPEFTSVEKIKTIGATYMVASGLNTAQRNGFYHVDRNYHLKALLEFAVSMQETVRNFNDNMVGYEFVLRVGFNCGPVTAGVVGSTKLLYDIWGNTVNVASRMDSTGVAGRIQVPDECLDCLMGAAKFTQRPDTVFVKGKGDMVTHLLDSVVWPHHYRAQKLSSSGHTTSNPAVVVSGAPKGAGDEKWRKRMLFHRDSISGPDDHFSMASSLNGYQSATTRCSLVSDTECRIQKSTSVHGVTSVSAPSLNVPGDQSQPAPLIHPLHGSLGRLLSPGDELAPGRLLQDDPVHDSLIKTFSLPTNAAQRISLRLSTPS
eukprot:scpid12122/ scgid15902/ Adenylate cyclase type 9; ATP pyrophosphate-lyase 9; Adenylate cyclase type IX; Adenylyl cyclase 9